MTKEIGSEFWDIPVCENENQLFPEETVWFISGRSALRAIIAENDFKSVGIPSWCCDSIIKPFADKGIKIHFYDSEIPSTDAILVMDFFGYSTGTTWEKFDGIVIRDLTHSIFTEKHDDADYYFGSLRKWAGFWTGGFAWGFREKVIFKQDSSYYFDIREKAMNQKIEYINLTPGIKSIENDSKTFLKEFSKAEAILEEIGILPASPRDIELAQKLDITFLKKRRRENAQFLLNAFDNIALFPILSENDCPLFVPISVSDREGLRKYLIQHGIFCPVHWPITEYHNLTDSQVRVYKDSLSLICDQRYNKNDMERIVLHVKKYLEMRV